MICILPPEPKQGGGGGWQRTAMVVTSKASEGNGSNSALNRLRGTALGLATLAAVFIPEHRIAAGNRSVLQVDPVGTARSQVTFRPVAEILSMS